MRAENLKKRDMERSMIQEVVEYIGEIEENINIYTDHLNAKLTTLAGLFRGKRKDAGVSLRDAAKKLKVSAAYLSDVELGRRRVSEENFTRFVDYFDAL